MDDETRRLMRERWLAGREAASRPSSSVAVASTADSGSDGVATSSMHAGSKRPRPGSSSSSSSSSKGVTSRMPVTVTVYLVGRGHHTKGSTAPSSFEPGQKVSLEREPDNKVDDQAIEVFAFDSGNKTKTKLGYISGGQASHLSPALDSGELQIVEEESVLAPPDPDQQTSTRKNSKPPLPIALSLRVANRNNGRPSRLASAALRILALPFHPPSTIGSGVTPAQRSAASLLPQPPAGGGTVDWIRSDLAGADGDAVAFAVAYPPTLQDSERAYVYVSCPKGRYRGAPRPIDDDRGGTATYTGKWMIMGLAVDRLDAYFVEAARLVQDGHFIAAKAPTGLGGQTKQKGVIIMYTNDFRNRDDVQRAGEAAKSRFGTNRMYMYKTDASTLAGKYAKDGKGPTSAYLMKTGGTTLIPNEKVIREDLAYAGGTSSSGGGSGNGGGEGDWKGNIAGGKHNWGGGQTLGESLAGDGPRSSSSVATAMPSDDDQLAWALRESAKEAAAAGTAEDPVCL